MFIYVNINLFKDQLNERYHLDDRQFDLMFIFAYNKVDNVYFNEHYEGVFKGVG